MTQAESTLPIAEFSKKELPISETVSLKSEGFDEAWLQNQIWQNPSCLGLGDLETVTKEHAISSGGRLDILLKDPSTDAMYEIETMLGGTDPDHIVRTIEYWDLVKRKWPQRQHFAVLVAEHVTRRFFNILRIVSDVVPLIAIQVNIVKSPHGRSLHFTKILDIYEEPDDETGSGSEVFDEVYWANKSKEVLEAAKFLFQITSDIYSGIELRFNKYSIAFVSPSGYVQLRVRKAGGNSIGVGFPCGQKRDEIIAILEDNGIQFTKPRNRVYFLLLPEAIKEKADAIREIAQLNKEWWTH